MNPYEQGYDAARKGQADEPLCDRPERRRRERRAMGWPDAMG